MKKYSASKFMRFAAAGMVLSILASLCACGVQHEGIYITTDGIYYLGKNGEKMTGYIESEGTLYYFGEDEMRIREADKLEELYKLTTEGGAE